MNKIPSLKQEKNKTFRRKAGKRPLILTSFKKTISTKYFVDIF